MAIILWRDERFSVLMLAYCILKLTIVYMYIVTSLTARAGPLPDVPGDHARQYPGGEGGDGNCCRALFCSRNNVCKVKGCKTSAWEENTDAAERFP